ncbi:hypothetical protein WR25_25710 [Diploscapter pachys]|uniref:Uncharacterized protein n=1 Tax=Diploscapter pachys TaxID=2018661 RepID=A0A2A2K063_9BILA|nr:hypothetical protein WR25_25710 [Diploscapter pachys]
MIAMTSRMWIKPPAMWSEKPSSHRISRITAIVHNMIGIPLFARPSARRQQQNVTQAIPVPIWPKSDCL